MYLDPGSGSILIQLILGAVLAIGIVVRLSWKKIRSLFSKSTPEETSTVSEDADDPK